MSEKQKDYGREEAAAQYASIAAMIAAVNVDYDRLEELRDQLKTARVVGWNMPGYMPDNEPFTVDDAESARAALADEMEERADQIEYAADLVDENDNGRDDSDDLRADVAELRALRAAANYLRLDTTDCEEYAETIGGMHYWFTTAERLADDDDQAELAELEAAAGDCESEEEAREQIEEDPLSIEVRSDWVRHGGEMTPGEFRILLCTGGPHVEMRGELDDNGEPRRAWLEYSDWNQSRQEYHGEEVNANVLIEYARHFFTC